MSHFKRLLSYSKAYHPLNAGGLLLSFTAIVIGLCKPYLTKMIVDDVLIAGDFRALTPLAGVFVVLTLLRVVVQYGKTYLFEHTSQKVLYDFRSDLYRKLQYQSFAFLDKVRTGLLMNRLIGDLQAVRQFLNSGYVQAFEALFTFVFTLVVMLTMNIPLTLALFCFLPLLYITTKAMSKRLRPVFQDIRGAFEDLTSYVQENVTGIRVVKAFGREDYEKERFWKVAESFTSHNIEASEIRSRFVPLTQFINGAGALLILLFGGYLVMQGRLTIGTLVAFNGYLLAMQMPINSVTGLVNQWNNAQASLEKIFDLMDERNY